MDSPSDWRWSPHSSSSESQRSAPQLFGRSECSSWRSPTTSRPSHICPRAEAGSRQSVWRLHIIPLSTALQAGELAAVQTDLSLSSWSWKRLASFIRSMRKVSSSVSSNSSVYAQRSIAMATSGLQSRVAIRFYFWWSQVTRLREYDQVMSLKV